MNFAFTQVIAPLNNSTTEDKSTIWQELKGYALDLRDEISSAVENTELASDEDVTALMESLSDTTLAQMMNNRPLVYTKRVNSLDAGTENGIINTGENNDVYQGQLHERGTLQTSELGHDEGRTGYLFSDGISKTNRFNERQNFGRNSELGNGAVQLDKLIKQHNKEAHYVATPEATQTRENAVKFHDAIERASQTQQYGLYVSVYPVDDIDHGDWIETGYNNKDIRLFLSDDGSTGFALHKDDIVSVFSDKTVANHPNSAYSILLNAISNGGRKLDCYGKNLVTLYERMGFVVDGKIPFNMDYASAEWKAKIDILGQPDVFALHWGDSSIEETLSKLPERLKTINKNAVEEQIASMPYFGTKDDYEPLLKYRDDQLEAKKAREKLTASSEDAQLVAEKQKAKNGDTTTYTKNVDYTYAQGSLLVPYTTEQIIGRIKQGMHCCAGLGI